jgi:ActR/RegA family two-component response regulator
MVLNEFLRATNVANKFFSETQFIELLSECSAIAQNAKAGTVENWHNLVYEQLAKIDQAIVNFQTTESTILIENEYLQLVNSGLIIFDFQNIIRNAFEDILTADTSINVLVGQVQSLKANTEKIVASLEGVGIDAVSPEERDENIVRFDFTHLSEITNLKELYTTSRQLNIHLRSLAKLDPDTTINDIEIAVLSKSSPLEISAWITKKVAEIINVVVGSILDNYQKIQELQLMSEHIKQAKLDTNDKAIESVLKERRAKFEVDIIDDLTKKLIKDCPSESCNGNKNEIETGVRKAVEYFIDQTSKGLEVRVFPTAAEIQADSKDIIQSYEGQRLQAQEVLGKLPARAVKEVSDSKDNVEVAVEENPTAEVLV